MTELSRAQKSLIENILLHVKPIIDKNDNLHYRTQLRSVIRTIRRVIVDKKGGYKLGDHLIDLYNEIVECIRIARMYSDLSTREIDICLGQILSISSNMVN